MQSEKLFLRPTLIYSSFLYPVNDHIKSWDLSEKEGEGAYIKQTGTPHYGHVKLRIQGLNDDTYSNEIIWLVNKTQLPPWYRNGIVNACAFFLSYFEAIKGKRHYLNFKVLDASYHSIDSKEMDSETATICAIVNCFDKDLVSITPINEYKRATINRCKEAALERQPPY